MSTLDPQLMQLDRELRDFVLQLRRDREQVRTYRMGLELMGNALADREVLLEAARMEVRLAEMKPRVEGMRRRISSLSRRLHRSRRVNTSAFGRIGNLRGQRVPEVEREIGALDRELRGLREALHHRFVDPLRTPTPFDGGMADLFNVILEMLGLVLKHREQARQEDQGEGEAAARFPFPGSTRGSSGR